MNLTTRMSDKLAARSSRRNFLRLSTGSALGAGLALSGSKVALAETQVGCVGCGGGGGTSCGSPTPVCNSCPTGCNGGGCAYGYDFRGSWTVCHYGCKRRCVECCKNGAGCHCFQALPYACEPGRQCPC